MADRPLREVLWARRAWPEAQRLLAAAGAPERWPNFLEVGWFGTSVEPERGAFAVIGQAAGLDDLIGEILRVSSRGRAAYVYVLGARPVPTELALSRRAFLALGSLGLESLRCAVEVLR